MKRELMDEIVTNRINGNLSEEGYETQELLRGLFCSSGQMGDQRAWSFRE